MQGKIAPAIPAGFTPGITPNQPLQVAATLPPPMPVNTFAALAPSVTPIAPIVNEAPPIPEEGLPKGWTEEQWKHYGSKWLSERAKK
jgi:hypothetical protein